jgi:hypothetical protein
MHDLVVPPLLGADDIENTACVLDRVYRAVAWQHVDQIRYNTEQDREQSLRNWQLQNNGKKGIWL